PDITPYALPQSGASARSADRSPISVREGSTANRVRRAGGTAATTALVTIHAVGKSEHTPLIEACKILNHGRKDPSRRPRRRVQACIAKLLNETDGGRRGGKWRRGDQSVAR